MKTFSKLFWRVHCQRRHHAGSSPRGFVCCRDSGRSAETGVHYDRIATKLHGVQQPTIIVAMYKSTNYNPCTIDLLQTTG